MREGPASGYENQETVIPVPRDRKETVEPHVLPKYQKRVPRFNDQIISLYSLGMTDRDIKAHLEKSYTVEVSPELISRVTQGVMEAVSDSSPRSGGTSRLRNPRR
jgi:transposase-like protein